MVCLVYPPVSLTSKAVLSTLIFVSRPFEEKGLVHIVCAFTGDPRNKDRMNCISSFLMYVHMYAGGLEQVTVEMRPATEEPVHALTTCTRPFLLLNLVYQARPSACVRYILWGNHSIAMFAAHMLCDATLVFYLTKE